MSQNYLQPLDIEIYCPRAVLKIRSEKKQEKEEKEKDFYRVERSYGSFQRTLSLPDDADSSGIGANFSKGVLIVSIPRKAALTSETKRIPFNS
ncbi:MAG: Hsp20/alpha crystallin family protein [Desulfuromonadales bacterium]|nr:Hsp20/alpha crystallin family protein [Desulfuromonadales bacterium]